MKVKLQVEGREEVIFAKVEEITVLEENSEETIFRRNELIQWDFLTDVAKEPTEGKWFEVNPITINQELFKKKRFNLRQERTRKLILEAFEVMANQPEYTRAFKTKILEKTWVYKTVRGLKELANENGDHNADWVEQALEWAQRINNGESWRQVCNKRDPANFYRLVIWKNGSAHIVGGSLVEKDRSAASRIGRVDYYGRTFLNETVPNVVKYS